MRKLAPMFILSSVVALAAGNVLANDTLSSTDKNGEPTVSANKNATSKDLSYSDKSNTSPGTNATMKDKSAAAGTTDKMVTDTAQEATTTNAAVAHDEDNKDLDKHTNKPAKKKAKKVASNNKAKIDAPATDMPTANPTNTTTPPLSATKAEAANSTTGKSAGQ